MEHIHNNLMKLGGSLGNVPQKKNEKKIQFITTICNLVLNCTLENGLTVRNISSFYNKFFIFVSNIT
jgi:hypothetical protein